MLSFYNKTIEINVSEKYQILKNSIADVYSYPNYKKFRDELFSLDKDNLKKVLNHKNATDLSLIEYAMQQWGIFQLKNFSANENLTEIEHHYFEINIEELEQILILLFSLSEQYFKEAYQQYEVVVNAAQQYNKINDIDINPELYIKNCELFRKIFDNGYICAIFRGGKNNLQINFNAIQFFMDKCNDLKLLEKFYNILMQFDLTHFNMIQKWVNIKPHYEERVKELQASNQNLQELESFLKNPKEKLIVEKDQFALIATQLVHGRYLKECSCNFFQRSTREKIENNIIRDVLTHYNDEAQLQYASLGAGNLLQDFFIIGKLIQKGIKSINIILIEPSLSQDSLGQFKKELYQLAIAKNTSLSISTFNNIAEFKNEDSSRRIHVFAAIDFEDVLKHQTFNNIIQAHQLLAEHGRLYFSFGEHQFIFNKNKCLDYINAIGCEEILNNIKVHLNTPAMQEKLLKDSVHYVNLGLENKFEEWVMLLPILSSHCQHFIMTLVQPRVIGYFGGAVESGRINSDFNENNLSYFLKLFINDNVTLDVNIINTPKDFLLNESIPQCDIVMLYNYDLSENKWGIDPNLLISLINASAKLQSYYKITSGFGDERKEYTSDSIAGTDNDRKTLTPS